MNINKLRIFHEVFVTGSITRAAERCYVSQPAASKMLANFESEIGYKLFVRSNGKLIPTEESLFLHEEIYSLLKNVGHLEDSLKRAKNNTSGSLRICSTFGPSYQFLPDLICRFREEYPDVYVSLHLLGDVAIRQGVASGQYQIGLMDKAPSSLKHDSASFDLTCYCAVPQHHASSKLEVITPEDVLDLNWITLDSENATTKALKKIHERRGEKLTKSIEVHTTVHAMSFVNLGVGATLVDAVNYRNFEAVFNLPNVVIRPFEPNVIEPLQVITSNLNPLTGTAKHFYEMLLMELNRTEGVIQAD